MENNSVVIYEHQKAEIKPYRNNYNVVINGNHFSLDRDTDFGMIRKKDGSPISNKPTLFKSGAHKILTAYGLAYLTELTDKKVDLESGIFYFEFKATAYFNGQPVRTGWGCANTNEKSTGFASSWDVANSKMKIAEKRAEVDLAIKLADASGWFVADLEDTQNEARAQTILGDNDPITSKQATRLFAIAGNNEITRERAKSLLAEWGYSSTKDITQKAYEEICERFANYGK